MKPVGRRRVITRAVDFNHAGSALEVSFQVPFQYGVFFTDNLFDPGNLLFADQVASLEPGRRHRALVCVDAGLLAARPGLVQEIEAYFQAHSKQLELCQAPLSIPGGEACKNDPELPRNLLRVLAETHLDRHAFVVAVGGGALLDLVGYAAAIAHRGVRLVRVPTTVLSQNDSGVGVKNGVNRFGLKNFVGTFAPPFAVFNDIDLLRTLPGRDRRAGLAEAVKVALIRDAAFFHWLEDKAEALAAFETRVVRHAVRRCAELHVGHITGSGDPFERGSARPLDYGHWLAHKLEALSSHRVRHGEAVAIGLAVDTRYAVEMGQLAPEVATRVAEVLQRLGFPLWAPELSQTRSGGARCVFDGLDEFREHLGGELTVTLLSDVGVAREVHEMDLAALERALIWVQGRAESGAFPNQRTV